MGVQLIPFIQSQVSVGHRAPRGHARRCACTPSSQGSSSACTSSGKSSCGQWPTPGRNLKVVAGPRCSGSACRRATSRGWVGLPFADRWGHPPARCRAHVTHPRHTLASLPTHLEEAAHRSVCGREWVGVAPQHQQRQVAGNGLVQQVVWARAGRARDDCHKGLEGGRGGAPVCAGCSARAWSAGPPARLPRALTPTLVRPALRPAARPPPARRGRWRAGR